MAPAIICFDVDGTLVDRQGRLHPQDVALLSGAQPVDAVLIPATGRPLHALRSLFNRHGLFQNQPIPLPLVLQNGALLYQPGEVLWGRAPFSAETQARLLERMWAYPQTTFLWMAEDQVYVQWPAPFAQQMAARFELQLQPFETAGEQQFYKMMAISEDHAPIEALLDETVGWPLERAHSIPQVLEINAHRTDKAHGLQSLLAALGLEHAPRYAAGDGENDLPMFRLARRSFAPSSSPEGIRATADRVIDVSREGVIQPILRELGI